jgi:hypothetical protein
MSASRAIGEEEVVTADGERPYRVLHRVVVDLDAIIIKIDVQFGPELQRMKDRRPECYLVKR